MQHKCASYGRGGLWTLDINIGNARKCHLSYKDLSFYLCCNQPKTMEKKRHKLSKNPYATPFFMGKKNIRKDYFMYKEHKEA